VDSAIDTVAQWDTGEISNSHEMGVIEEVL